MASGKSRSNKRSSGTSSYSSSTTIVIFIAFSLLGLWLLTSNSFAPPQSTKTPTRISSIAHSHHSKPSITDVHPVDHEDIPTQLPNDAAIQSTDDANESNETQDDKKDDQETKQENDEPKTDNDIKTDDGDSKELQGEESAEEQEKQKALETQTSEESTVTQKQEVEQTIADGNQHVENVDPESNEKVENTGISRNEMTDEDQQQRVDEHQQQEDDQIQPGKPEWRSRDPNGATSDAQIEHDEAPIHSDTDETTAQVEESKVPKESKKSRSTQPDNHKERRKARSNDDNKSNNYGYTWQLCNVTAGADYIPCLDNEKVIAKIHSRKHHEHRERHCPDEPPTCLIPLPKGYKTPVDWPQSRDKIWYHNVPHTSLAEVKGHQNWVKLTGEFLTFPGGGTQFIHGALHYIDFRCSHACTECHFKKAREAPNGPKSGPTDYTHHHTGSTNLKWEFTESQLQMTLHQTTNTGKMLVGLPQHLKTSKYGL